MMAEEYEFWAEPETLISQALRNGVSPTEIRVCLEEYRGAMDAIDNSKMPRHALFTDIIAKRERKQAA